MATPVILPKLEMSQETATLVEWLKKEGEAVQKGEPLFIVETDKVTVEVEATESGLLAQIVAGPGDTLPVTSVIAHLLEPGEQLPEKHPLKPPAATPLAARIASVEGLDLAALSAQGEIAGSGPGGKIRRADVENALLFNSEGLRASPAARRIARELGVDLEDVTGSGLRGRIQGSDVRSFSNQAHASPVESEQPALQPHLQSLDGQEWTVMPLQGMRRTIAERITASYQSAPHITFTARVDFTGLETLRGKLNARATQTGEAKVSLTAALIGVLGLVLRHHPLLNARLVEIPGGAEIHLLKRIHIGMAVALPDGLIVPVVRDADRKPMREVAREVLALAEKARQGKLAPQDVSGGTFTVSNLGPFGIEQFTAILNPGQTGILAVGAAQPEALVVGEQVLVRPVARLTLSVDHRVVDGAVAAHFMTHLKEALETPALALW